MTDPFAARAELGDLRYEADCERHGFVNPKWI
jgi:hypothetical protein